MRKPNQIRPGRQERNQLGRRVLQQSNPKRSTTRERGSHHLRVKQSEGVPPRDPGTTPDTATFRTTRFLCLSENLNLAMPEFTTLSKSEGVTEQYLLASLREIYLDIIDFPGVRDKERQWKPDDTIEKIVAWLNNQLKRIQKIVNTRGGDIGLMLNNGHLQVIAEKEITNSIANEVRGLVDMSFLLQIRKPYRILHNLVIDVVKVAMAHMGKTMWADLEDFILPHLEEQIDPTYGSDDLEEEDVAFTRKIINSFRNKTGDYQRYKKKLTFNYEGVATGKLSYLEPGLRKRFNSYCRRKALSQTETMLLDWLRFGLDLIACEGVDIAAVGSQPLEVEMEQNGEYAITIDRSFDFVWKKDQDYINDLINQEYQCDYENYGEVNARVRAPLRGLKELPSKPIWLDIMGTFMGMGQTMVWDVPAYLAMEKPRCPDMVKPKEKNNYWPKPRIYNGTGPDFYK